MKGFFSSVGCQQRLSHFLSICFLPCLFSCIFFYFLSFSLLITLSLKTDSAKEFVTVFCFSPAREGKLTKHKQLVTELKQIFQVTVLYLSIYFSQNFKLFTPCNSFKYHVIWCRSTLLSQHPKTNFSAHHAWQTQPRNEKEEQDGSRQRLELGEKACGDKGSDMKESESGNLFK